MFKILCESRLCMADSMNVRSTASALPMKSV